MNKKRIIWTVVLIIVIAGPFYANEWMKYTSLNEKALNQITKNDEVRIDIRRESDSARVSITDKEMVDKILNELSVVELKKESFTEIDGDYRVRIYVNGVNKLSMAVFVDKNYVIISNEGDYKIVNQNNFKKVFEYPNLKWAVSKDNLD
ncbi:hypothetical protein QNK09_04240 [Brevibacillus agri]|uniref:hypothetical protein n=1 Tax=Brevibacillus TaxID=55080 RepID=UPI0004722F5E|nr:MULTISPECIES: hypothetical protein [Brevibacillus]QHZ58385.1 hypothetical protein M655_023585 [Brevibacillus sp. NSP2.1]WHX31455.1 hypothetical protein QNK09_04240 [Brevibacillus agri]